MTSVAVLPRLLGALFYYSPGTPEIDNVGVELGRLPDLYPWVDKHALTVLCAQWVLPAADDFNYQFSVLFEGQGEMSAPPWGSVYLDQKNLLMGDSLARYRTFLRQQGLSFSGQHNEPEDQFGLMLLALAWLLEQDNNGAAKVLLEQHLLPWSGRYLTLLAANTVSDFYARLARIADIWLQDLRQRYDLHSTAPRLYF
ncbi:molecular chaperone [Acerihabitans sp. TG2]|uniref:molecular chaperone n=1 Tax=Acerihabitans sp. TG2 TaxID=3096008 RepID=UPI002B229680|nr:molecular chaperone [Acerihabitans sp. TG2]MEA9392116.1 molecular chaperone [Acerihabitans sp. TG2]